MHEEQSLVINVWSNSSLEFGTLYQSACISHLYHIDHKFRSVQFHHVYNKHLCFIHVGYSLKQSFTFSLDNAKEKDSESKDSVLKTCQ